MADRMITINIRKYLVTQPRTKRAKKAAKYIRERVAHYTKLDPENVRIGQKLNELIFKYYSRRMVPVKVRVKIGTDTADVLPFAEQETKVQEPAKPAKKSILNITKSEPKKEAPKEEKKTQAKEKPAQQEKKQAN